MANRIIFGVLITDRVKNILDVQKALTEHGCNIKTRLGLHEVTENFCAPGGLVILEMVGKESDILSLETKLKAVEGVQIQKMVFEK